MTPPKSILPFLLANAVAVSCLWINTSLAVAADSSTSSSPASSSTTNSTLDAALTACATSVTKDANGGPDRTAMASCMQAKGFTPPSGGPGGNQKGGNNPPPPPPPGK